MSKAKSTAGDVTFASSWHLHGQLTPQPKLLENEIFVLYKEIVLDIN